MGEDGVMNVLKKGSPKPAEAGVTKINKFKFEDREAHANMVLNLGE